MTQVSGLGRWLWWSVAPVVLAAGVGCRNAPTPPSADFGPPVPGPVTTLDGKVLDAKASPQDVAIAGLKAIAADLSATASGDRAAALAARRVLYALTAPGNAFQTVTLAQAGRRPAPTSQSAIQEMNTWWTQAIGHYAQDWDYTPRTMSFSVGPTASSLVSILYLTRAGITPPRCVRVSLLYEGGYYRIAGVDLTAPPQSATQPTSAPAAAVSSRPSSRPLTAPPASAVPPSTNPASVQ